MLDYRHLGRGLAGADALRRYRERTGTVGRDKVWSDEETETLRRLYPDYKAAMKALPGRTYGAIKFHAMKHGIARRRHVWTNIEVARLRKLAAAGASNKQLFAGFPEFREQQILGKLYHCRMKRPRRQFRSTGHPLLDALRSRCHALGLSMVDVDDIARTRRYFTGQTWLKRQAVDVAKVAKAIDALGGTLSVSWQE